MAYNKEGFITTDNLVGAVNGVPLKAHRYATPDAKATVETAGYFNTLRDQGLIAANEPIDVIGGIGGTAWRSSYIFASVPATGNVTLTEMALGA